MPPPAAAPRVGGTPYGFLLIAILIHFMDVLMRYGTIPFDIGTTPGSPWLWVAFFFAYALVWLDANVLPAFSEINKPTLLLFALIAYLWGPFWSIIPGYVPALKYIAALLMLIAPFWVLISFYATQAFDRLSLLYTIIWLFLITFALFPAISDFAEEQGYPLPDSLSPGRVIEYSFEKIKTGSTNFYQYFFVKAPAQIEQEVKRSIAIASGDYYTGKVDSAAQKRLGIYFEKFRAAEPKFYTNTPVTAYMTMKAETLDKPLDVNIECIADDNESASRILPRSTFNILGSEQYEIDCIWNQGVLGKGGHKLKVRSTFDFSTKSYLRAYMMDRDRLREYRRQGVEPLEDVPDKSSVAIYTSGPVRIGMSVGQQPIAVMSDETLQPWGITIQNAWEGKVLDIKGIFLLLPKGLEIIDPGDVGVGKSGCGAMPAEEQAGCDDSIVNVYQLTEQELAKQIYKNLTTKTMRLYMRVADSQQVLGTAPIAVQNFKVAVHYTYMLERELSTTIIEATETTT